MFSTLVPPPLSRNLALFLDFDGTLAPIQDDPNSVYLSEGQLACLNDIAQGLDGAMAIVSGRDVRDLSGRVPTNLWRVGSHGLETRIPGDVIGSDAGAAPDQLVSALDEVVTGLPGTRLEIKGEVLALHFRARPEAGDQLKEMMAAILLRFPDYKYQIGKCVIEAKPKHADKGMAVERLMQDAAFKGRVPVMVGDDATDEDAIQRVNAMGGWSVKVGDGKSEAGYRVAGPPDVWNWLSGGVE